MDVRSRVSSSMTHFAEQTLRARETPPPGRSARASTDGGTVRPIALAVLTLTAKVNFVGACNGRLAGFSPLRISIAGKLVELLKEMMPHLDARKLYTPPYLSLFHHTDTDVTGLLSDSIAFLKRRIACA